MQFNPFSDGITRIPQDNECIHSLSYGAFCIFVSEFCVVITLSFNIMITKLHC